MNDCDFTVTWSKRIEYLEKNSNDVPKSEGVYEIQGHISSQNEYTRKYVGRSDDLRRRYLEHLSDDEQNQALKKFLKEKLAFFRYTKTENESVSKDVEKGLYDKYKHNFNDPNNPSSGSGKCKIIQIKETNP